MTSWRKVIHPREDVMQGKLTLSSFAADLGDAVAGRGGVEYKDCAEFFSMTYLTDGLTRLLSNALRRVNGLRGDSVIQVKTAFGGGKTHSMLALYHMMRRRYRVEAVLNLAGVRDVPDVKLSVLAFNHKNPLKPDRVGEIRTRTLFGAMAAQLGGYEYVRANDEKGVSPGKADFIRMFNELGPCVVLMDELVAYGRKIRGARGLSEGMNYGNFLTFLQEVTEAASQSPNSLIVATLPESETEAGDANGVAVLHEVEHIFGRLESVWKPVTANEGFEIVKKRLFRGCEDLAARAATADSFYGMYRNNPGDFPAQTREPSYRQRLIDCYPFHPELFDRLYEDWSTLELFQRTRGVLRFLARVVRELCANNDNDELIMPGSLPLSRSDVMEELTRPLPSHDVWNGIVASDIDGGNSASLNADMSNERFSQVSACRRNARTIMLGSAPLNGREGLRGVERPGVLLGSVRPGDNIAVFNEALNAMRGTLSYLYTDGAGMRYWFDTAPNLQKTVRIRAEQVDSRIVDEEIRRRLVRLSRDSSRMLAGVHVWPDSSQDVPDDDRGLRVVLLRPEADEARMLELLLTHGNTQRVHQNSIIFLSASLGEVQDLRRKVRLLIAWNGIKSERESLNLGMRQLREVDDNISRSNVEVDSAVRMSWRKVYVPRTKYGERIDAIEWDKLELSVNEGLIDSLVSGLTEGDLVTFNGRRYAPSQLFACMDDCNLWRGKNFLLVSELWNDFCTYGYLHKLADFRVLSGAILDGVMTGECGLAGEVNGLKYEDLRFRKETTLSSTDYIVRKEAASAQRSAKSEPTKKDTPEFNVPIEEGKPLDVPEPPKVKPEPTVRHFHMHTTLNEASMVKEVSAIQREVIENLRNLGKLTIRLQVDLEASSDIDPKLRSDINANCKDLRIDFAEFD